MQYSEDILFRHCKVEEAVIQPKKRGFVAAMLGAGIDHGDRSFIDLLNVWETVSSLLVQPMEITSPA
jgi:hypothetical protein